MIKSLFEHDEDIKETPAETNKTDGESIEEIAEAIETGSFEKVQIGAENVSINKTENPAETFFVEEIKSPKTLESAKEIKQVEPIPTFQITEPTFENQADREELHLEIPDYETELEAQINKIAAQTSPVRADQSIIENTAPFENTESSANQASQSQTESILTNKKEYSASEPTFQFEKQSETIRRTGLAFSAAITLFGAVAFMMIIGWFFDLVCGTSPWGIVGGVAFGALIGFIQFFRQTSQIFKKDS